MIATLSRPLLDALTATVGANGLLWDRGDMMAYECDGYVIEKHCPDIVVFPTTTQQVSDVVRIACAFDIPIVARGAGTGLAGGTLPVGGGMLIVLTKMTAIEEVHLRDRYAVVQAGVVNIKLNERLKGTGYHYAPDPSSQGACTIGGNTATNSGGPHTLKYGVTVNHVLGVEVVFSDGSIVRTGGPSRTPGLNLTGAIVGSEGTLAIVTRVWVRLTRLPQAVRTMLIEYGSVEEACRTIGEIIGAGIIPAALELMDQGIVRALEAAFSFGFPLDAAALLLVEVDGIEDGINQQMERVVELATECKATGVRHARDSAERQKLWKCRKLTGAAIGRLAPNYTTQDGVVPRSALPHILQYIANLSARSGIEIVNVAHAGDGNIHPNLLFDEREPDQIERVIRVGQEILEECLACGGSVSGEHGIGVEKISLMDRMFSADDLDVMRRFRNAVNPDGRLGAGKMLPTLAGCGITQSHPRRRGGL